jgi:hypothetical protein
MRLASALALASVLLAAPAAAQRHVDVVPELEEGTLSSLLLGQQGAIERCAARTRTSGYVATVRARVTPGPPPSTLYGARIGVAVTSRPRDGAFEGCVTRALRDTLRQAPYAVTRAVSAQHTFQIAERPLPPVERPPPPFDASEVRRTLASYQAPLQQCLGVAGVPEQVTLRVAVRPDGQLVLTSADLPPGVAASALGCLSSRVSSLRIQGRPSRTTTVVHTLGVRSHAY